MVLGFSTKSKPKRPLYEEQSDTPWITRNRDMNTWSYDNVKDNINRVNVFDDSTKQSLSNRVDDVYNRALSDFNRSYNNTMNNQLQRDYNRFGTTGASNALYNRDTYNLQSQRKLADLAYDKAITYDDLMDKELARRYNFIDTNYDYFKNSGKTTQDFDNANWHIRNMNKDVQYLNDIQDYNNSFEHKTDQLAHSIGGAVASIWLGPAGIALGDATTQAFASDAQPMGSGFIGNYGSVAQHSNPFSWEDMAGTINYLYGNGAGSVWNTLGRKNSGNSIGNSVGSSLGSMISNDLNGSTVNTGNPWGDIATLNPYGWYNGSNYDFNSPWATGMSSWFAG